MVQIYNKKNASVMCPKCKKFLAKGDKRDESIHKLTCKHCKKWIWFRYSDGYAEIKEQPKRTQASGMRFY